MKGYQWLLVGIGAMLMTACSSNRNSVVESGANAISRDETALLLKSSSPAEVNCTLAGGTMAMSRQLNGSNIGTCQLVNGKRCDESSLLNGMCPAG
ncbi:MAG: DUF333 domain-containing protein [Symbiopectobacterium sp.]|uniref:putative hemolysin n=1 Tax=Symbiopectobacterium sp. TaxID=2952789 RepID=UPI0039ED5A71